MKYKIIKQFLLFLLIFNCIFYIDPIYLYAKDDDPIEISAPSAILMEATTGSVLYAKNENEELPMASVTKVMTMYLIFEAISAKKLTLADEITISEYAASMGGSQAFLEAGEIQTVETLLKCISIASANDAAVAMAEAISGSEASFVELMNNTAKDLHMEHTNFINCCGLDIIGHYSCAKDLAIISRQLITKYPAIYDYCTIWQEDMIHNTRKGSFPFTLTNTNKLLKQYPYATGLKTGSTSQAKYCLSSCASKDNMTLIAVIMAAPTPKDRFKDATALLNYGFSHTSILYDIYTPSEFHIPISKGTKNMSTLKVAYPFYYVITSSQNATDLTCNINMPHTLSAPIKKGDTLGTLDYYLNDKKIASIPLLATESIKKATYTFYLQQLIYKFIHVQENLLL